MKSKIFSSGYMKATAKGQMWIPVFLALGFFLTFPVAQLIMMGNWYGLGYDAEQIQVMYENLWIDGFLCIGVPIAGLAALFHGISRFWYLYFPGKVDFTHCLPVKRSRMFWCRALTGMIYFGAPCLVMEFLSICIGAMRGFFSLHIMGLAISLFLTLLLMYLLFYFTIVLVIGLTGNIFMGVAGAAGMFLYGPILAVLLATYEDSFFHTSWSQYDGGLIRLLLDHGSPLGMVGVCVDQYAKGKGIACVLFLLVPTVILAAAGYLAFVKRPMENTGKPLIFSWTEILIKILIVIPSGLGVGIIFYLLPNMQSQTTAWWIFGMILGTAAAHGILEVIFRMDFRKFFSHRLQLLGAGLAVAGCALIFQMDLLGFDAYMPPQEKIESISVQLYSSEATDVVTADGEGGFSFETQSALSHELGISSGIYEVMEKINRSTRTEWEHADAEGEIPGSGYESMPIAFQLKSGRCVYRNYLVSGSEMKELLLAAYQEGTLKEQKYSFLLLDESYLDNVGATFYGQDVYELFPGNKEKRAKLLEALREDVKEVPAEALTGMPCARLDFSYNNIPLSPSINRMVPGKVSVTSGYESIYVYPEFERTVALLAEEGYPLLMEEVPVDRVEIQYYTEAENYQEWSDAVVYDSEEELEELKKHMTRSALAPTWARLSPEKDVYASMNVYADGGELDCWLGVDGYPDFVLEDSEKALTESADGGGDAESESENVIVIGGE